MSHRTLKITLTTEEEAQNATKSPKKIIMPHLPFPMLPALSADLSRCFTQFYISSHVYALQFLSTVSIIRTANITTDETGFIRVDIRLCHSGTASVNNSF